MEVLTKLLETYLGYLTYVQPVVYGAQLCRSEQPDPNQVTNVTLTLIFAWVMEVADKLFLSSFIAMRTVYITGRIVLCLYFVHPKFLGAQRTYNKLFGGLVDTYLPMVDDLLLRHVAAVGEWGVVRYATTVGMTILRGVSEVFDIARRLLEATSATTVSPAPLPSRLSQTREGAALTSPTPDADNDERGAGPSSDGDRVMWGVEQDDVATPPLVPARRAPKPPTPPPRSPRLVTVSVMSRSLPEGLVPDPTPPPPPPLPPPSYQFGGSDSDSSEESIQYEVETGAPFAAVRPERGMGAGNAADVGNSYTMMQIRRRLHEQSGS